MGCGGTKNATDATKASGGSENANRKVEDQPKYTSENTKHTNNPNFKRVVPIEGGNKECVVHGCKEKHNRHRCQKCKDFPSFHWTLDCPTDPENKILKCKLTECYVRHRDHYCSICDKHDANHLEIKCPEAPPEEMNEQSGKPALNLVNGKFKMSGEDNFRQDLAPSSVINN
jgi:hypothetical protein